ncbi:diaminopimelate epimerase [Fusibacter ferrireducens]|uniref:Diaminopimelate epimerase n=1 Tax=Fusibacter ferrireducens TaxID=2785058 RepID=A0ABR9ZRA4_9FIRM|nr:diaminopimelate epimerase [Fusibacter ferrireducens]MBF4692984.1 diaminopimelate epimerase [Fusibacter ferrireducens]
MKFYKMQGTGNDFIIIDERRAVEKFEELYEHNSEARHQIAQNLCEIFGTDGVMFVLESKIADAKMRIFNADGTEAMMCGNGLRCFGRYVLDDLGLDEIKVETAKAEYSVKRVPDFNPYLEGFEILLNNVKAFGKTEQSKALEKQFDLKYAYDFEFFTISNLHVVSIQEKAIPNDTTLLEIGGYANSSDSPFELGVNVNFCTVLDEDKLYVRTFERGVGITKSCGTGMTSSVTRYARDQNRFQKWIEVFNDGGMIRCNVEEVAPDTYHAKFVGNASYEFAFEAEVERLGTLKRSELKIEDATHEVNQYQLFLEWTKKQIR